MYHSVEYISKITREELQSFVINNGHFSLSWAGACAISSLLLARVLKANNYKAKFVIGYVLRNKKDYNHAFVIIDDEIIDITASQFKLPKIYRQEIKSSMYFIEKTGYEALRELYSWPETQNPFNYKKELYHIYKNILERINGQRV
jgi:hypothetical protein